MKVSGKKVEGKNHCDRLPGSRAAGPDGLREKRRNILVLEKCKNDPLKSLTVDKPWAKQWLFQRTVSILLWLVVHFGSGNAPSYEPSLSGSSKWFFSLTKHPYITRISAHQALQSHTLIRNEKPLPTTYQHLSRVLQNKTNYFFLRFLRGNAVSV